MPFSSQAQQRFAFGTGQPWAKRWADETDFSKLPKRVKRIRSRRLKDCTCDEVTKESLGPGITRIRGNLCNVHGKYGPCDAALSGKKKPKKGRIAKPKKAPKVKLTPEQRAAARTAQREQNRASVARQMADSDTGLSPSGSAALASLVKGEQPSKVVGDGLVKMGLAELANDGSYRLTGTGHAANTAMESGDYQRAVDAISRGTDASTARGERTQAHQEHVRAAAQRKQEVAQRRVDAAAKHAARQAKRGSSGGSKKPAAAPPKPPASAAPTHARPPSIAPPSGGSSGGGSATPKPKAPAKQPAPVKQQPQIAPALRDAAAKLSAGTEMADDEVQTLIRNGLARLGKDGTPVLTAAGLRVTRKAWRARFKARAPHTSGEDYAGGSSAANDTRIPGPTSASPSGASLSGRFGTTLNQIPSNSFQTETRNDKPGRQVQGTATPDCSAVPSQTSVIGLSQRGQLNTTVVIKDAPPIHNSNISFAVYKDASGSDRWLSVSSTAYRDRDQEIVSTKALSGAVALADASGYRGPLRFWHVPNADFGDCDCQATAQDGRFLIESGTFRSPALAAAVKAHAGDYQISIGFTHPANEPDATGVFHHIAIFERSLVPRGRASNPFTQVALATKEQRMLTTEKQAELTRLLGGDSTLLQGLLETVATTDKAAQDGGVSFKDTPAETITINGVVYAPVPVAVEKAAPPMIEGSPEEEAAESPQEEAAEPDAMGADENMLTPAEKHDIAVETAQIVIAELMPHLDIGRKMDEVKSLMGGMAGSYAKKDAEQAELKEQVAAIKADVNTLKGEAPPILSGGYRASRAQATVTTDETKLKAAQPVADPVAASYHAWLADMGIGQPGA